MDMHDEEMVASVIAKVKDLPLAIRQGVALGCLLAAAAIKDKEDRGKMALTGDLFRNSLPAEDVTMLCLKLARWTNDAGIPPEAVVSLNRDVDDYVAANKGIKKHEDHRRDRQS